METNKANNKLRVGIVSVWWPPARGGTSVYALRLANALVERGTDVAVITAMPVDTDKQSEIFQFPVMNTGLWSNFDQFEDFLTTLHDTWCDHIIKWARNTGRTHLIFNNDYHGGIVIRLQKLGLKVGYLIHDYITKSLAKDLINHHWLSNNWEESFTSVIESERRGKTNHHHEMKSLRESWNFIIATTEIQRRMLDAVVKSPIFVLHPRIDIGSKSKAPLSPRVTVSSINPLPQKGSANFASMIIGAPRDWSFRIILGGWGDADETFPPLVQSVLPISGRIFFESYIPHMADFFSSSQVYLCPSIYEGYGMTPVEALYAGTPVVATDLPMIREGVGDAALNVPYFSHAGHWIDAVSEVLRDHKVWVERAMNRKAFLEQRQAIEFDAFISFLGAI